jgi:hypothetical protein
MGSQFGIKINNKKTKESFSSLTTAPSACIHCLKNKF